MADSDPVSVLGVDPGSRATGYAVLRGGGHRPKVLDYGVIRTDSDAPLPQRLRTIYEELRGVLEEHDPDEVAVEEVFAAANVRSALVLGQARGAILIAVGDGRPVFEYGARKVKKAVVGTGRADKKQVAAMMEKLLGLSETPAQDAADAMALAICHLHSRTFQRKVAATNDR